MTQELANRPSIIQLTPKEVVDNATTQSKLLMDIVEKTKCFQQIANKKYLMCEAWETIGAFNRTHAETETIEAILDNDKATIGYKAHVLLYRDGQVVGGAWMPCYFTENCCKGKEGDAKHKACMSAAQTFATSKAYRMNYSYVAILAGYEPTPAEEMGDDHQSDKKPPETKICPIHNVSMKERTSKSGGTFWSHKVTGTENTWCNGETQREATPKQETLPG